MRRARTTEFETRSGRLVDLLAPSIDDISFYDVASSLANTRRFNGHSEPYTNAQHSCLVAALLPEEHRIHGLLHDAPEFAVGDVTSPMKAALQVICPDFRRAFKYIDNTFLRVIYEKAGVAMPSEEVAAQVKRADLLALAIEQRDILHSPNVWNSPAPPVGFRLRAISSAAAFALYCDALEECGVIVEFYRPARPTENTETGVAA